MRSLTSSLAVVGLLSLAGLATAGVDMDHTNPQDVNLISTMNFAANQRNGTLSADNNSAVIDDFVASDTNVAQVQAAFEEEMPGNYSYITNWHLSIWNSVASAAVSGDSLTGNVVDVDLGVTGGVYTQLSGTGSVTGQGVLVDFNGLNIAGLTKGTQYWMALVPDLDADYGAEWLMSNTNPKVLGAGTPDDSWGINPGNGYAATFGLVFPVPLGSNAALFIRTGAAVPEPLTLALCAAGLGLALARRRKSA